jgi:hypothetical protein
MYIFFNILHQRVTVKGGNTIHRQTEDRERGDGNTYDVMKGVSSMSLNMSVFESSSRVLPRRLCFLEEERRFGPNTIPKFAGVIMFTSDRAANYNTHRCNPTPARREEW